MKKIALIPAFLLLLAVSCYGDIYKYVDENGVVCYTDAPLGRKTERVMKENHSPVQIQTPELKSFSFSSDYSDFVHRAAAKYEIEPELIHAVIKTESNGNHRAVSRKGAKGLMQLMPSTAMDMNVSNPFDPQENIEGGTRYLKYLLEKFNGDMTLALAAYNAGPKTVEKYGSVPPISETKQYVKKVYSLFKGKRTYDVRETAQQEKPAPAQSLRPVSIPVYKVVLDDGTILFTNSALSKPGKVRF